MGLLDYDVEIRKIICSTNAMAGRLGCFLPLSRAGFSHNVLLAVARP
jgi:hypothetical protein